MCLTWMFAIDVCRDVRQRTVCEQIVSREASMRVTRIGWAGTRTDGYGAMVEFYGGARIASAAAAARPLPSTRSSGDSFEVFGPSVQDNQYFTTGPVVGFVVEDLPLPWRSWSGPVWSCSAATSMSGARMAPLPRARRQRLRARQLAGRQATDELVTAAAMARWRTASGLRAGPPTPCRWRLCAAGVRHAAAGMHGTLTDADPGVVGTRKSVWSFSRLSPACGPLSGDLGGPGQRLPSRELITAWGWIPRMRWTARGD